VVVLVVVVVAGESPDGVVWDCAVEMVLVAVEDVLVGEVVVSLVAVVVVGVVDVDVLVVFGESVVFTQTPREGSGENAELPAGLMRTS
jgi:hypothetical protein